MKLLSRITIVLVACLSLHAAAQIPIPSDPSYEAVADTVFQQAVRRHIRTDAPVLSAAVLDGVAYAGDARGVYRVVDDALEQAGGPRSAVRRLRVINGALWAVGEKGLWRYADDAWDEIDAGVYTDVCGHLGGVVAASTDHLYRVEADAIIPLNATASGQAILGVQSYSESLYVRTTAGVGFLQDGRFEFDDDVSDWGELPIGAETRGLLALGSRLLVPTDQGLGVLRGMSWENIRGADGLCYEDTTCAAPGLRDNFWVGTTRGAIRAVDGAYEFFGFPNWLPHDRVNAIATDESAAYIATDGGLAIIEYRPYTLAKKAGWYKQHMKSMGMIHRGLITLLQPQGDGRYARAFGDNDVGYTCHYLDALCFEYAVSGDEAVRAEAVDIFKSIKWSEEITPIDGYPARSIYAAGEPGHKASKGSAGRPAEWNSTADGVWEWKGDTSSDEVVAQIYTVSLFHDLVAQGIEKKKAVEHLSRLIGHIIGEGWVLRDLDGEPTVWAQWSPEFIFSPDHTDERGLNALQALSFVAVAERLFPGPEIDLAAAHLAEWDYLGQVLRQKITFPHYTRFDDRLAFLAYYPLLRYEDDPGQRAPLMRSLQRSWEVKRIEKQSWFNYIYGALTGNDCQSAEAAEHLRAYPLDLVNHGYTNSHRDDLHNPPDYRNYLESWAPFSPREVGWQRWNRSFQQLDKGGGATILDPAGWLDAYWMGRYYGMIQAPATDDPALITVTPEETAGADVPHDGPERPAVF